MLRAVVYARCSTEEESQRDALKNQVFEAEECVRANGWILVDKYVESKSGTTTKGRKEYNRLFQDLLQDKFDIIVIKSQDRLMRNTKDWYLFIDRLTTSRKKLYMYIDRKFYSTDDALITGIKAILAEDYSRELSKKINNAHKNRQKHGGKPILTSRVYGLKKNADGTYEIIPEEAKIKARMYELAATGYGSYVISKILKEEGIVNRKGVPFNGANIRKMVENPLNMGTIVMNKRHYDFDTKRQFAVPESEHYVYPDKVPAIVSEELWIKANEAIKNRRKIKRSEREKPARKLFLSGKIICGLCGKVYYRGSHKNGKDKDRIYEWKCSTYIQEGRKPGSLARPMIRTRQFSGINGCDNVHLNEERLLSFLEEFSNEHYPSNKEEILEHAIRILTKTLNSKDMQSEIQTELIQKEKYEEQLNVLLDKLLDGLITDDVYQNKQNSILKKIKCADEKIFFLQNEMGKENEWQERIKNICSTLEEQNMIGKATVEEMINMIDKIVVYPEKMEFYFSYERLLGISSDIFEGSPKQEALTVECGNYFNPRMMQKENLQRVLDYMEENPKITAQQIAEKVGISKSGVQQRIARLKELGKVQFVGKGGVGHWEVLGTVIDKEGDKKQPKKKNNLSIER